MTLEILAVTNRLLCPGGTFLKQIEKIAASGVSAVILREKDLNPEDYKILARDVSAICAAGSVKFIVHSHIQTARNLGCSYVHLPWSPDFPSSHSAFTPLHEKFGVSVHSSQEALYALEQGASWLIAGHVFPTQSKEGLESRGLDFLSEICSLSPVPVYAIGGINEGNISAVGSTGVAGVCLMSSLMEVADPLLVVDRLKYC